MPGNGQHASRKLDKNRRVPVTAKCGAKGRSGKPCGMAAGQGTSHVGWGRCKLHGGNTPTGIKSAARLKLEAEMAAGPTLGGPIEVDPSEALLQEVHRAAGYVAWLSAKVATLDEADLFEPTPVGHQASALLRELQHEREMLRRAAESALKAGIAERQVRVAESQAQILAGVIRAVLSDPEIELTPASRVRVPSVVRRHLEAVPTTDVEPAAELEAGGG
jgi:hypothetical protein